MTSLFKFNNENELESTKDDPVIIIHPNPRNDDKDIDDDERVVLEEKVRYLRRQIMAAQMKRNQLVATKEAELKLQRIHMEKRNQAQRKRDRTVSMMQSVTCQRAYVDRQIEATSRMNAINDCFHIWQEGPYGTINGLRAGSFFPSSIFSAICPTSDTYNLNPSAAVRGLDFDLFNIFPYSNYSGSYATGPFDATSCRDQVCWFETNAALGTAALLLYILQENSDTNIQFSAYDIIPMGSYSKIATKVKGNNNTTPTVYNLYSDDRFSFFGKRSFNRALQGLLQCLLDAGECVTQRDKSSEFPYPITEDNTGELCIGGLTISYGTDSERWTTALKYFLTNLKWLVAFILKNVETSSNFHL
jgi:beclin 1